MKRIFIGADHAGFALKEKLKKWLDAQGILYEDCGASTFNAKDDYPDFAASVARQVVAHKTLGVVLCGSAEGVCIAANKIKGGFAVNPSTLLQTKLARQHEDANILCLAGGGSTTPQPGLSVTKAAKMLIVFLETKFSGAARHKRRIAKIRALER